MKYALLVRVLTISQYISAMNAFLKTEVRTASIKKVENCGVVMGRNPKSMSGKLLPVVKIAFASLILQQLIKIRVGFL